MPDFGRINVPSCSETSRHWNQKAVMSPTSIWAPQSNHCGGPFQLPQGQMTAFIGSVDQNVVNGAGPFETGNYQPTEYNLKVDHQGQLFQLPQGQMTAFIGSVDQNVANGAGPFETGNDRLTIFKSKVDHQGQLFQSPQGHMTAFIGSVDQNVANRAGPFENGNDEFEAEFIRFKAEMVPNHGQNEIQAELNRIKAQVVSRELQFNLTNFKYRPMMNSSSNRYDSPVDTSLTNFKY
jgi:hypothetical protein